RWYAPLAEAPEGVIASAASNAQFLYKSPTFAWSEALDIEDYRSRAKEFEEVVSFHAKGTRGYRQVMALPFFCVRIPYSVSTAVGPFDESFGKGGGEDGDYCLRAYLKGFSVQFALDSFVLHFQGKS